eukprot:1398209-Alexandrium_andersonii.AAC.2
MLKIAHASRGAKEVEAFLKLTPVAPDREATQGEAPLAHALLERTPLGNGVRHGLEGPRTEPLEARPAKATGLALVHPLAHGPQGPGGHDNLNVRTPAQGLAQRGASPGIPRAGEGEAPSLAEARELLPRRPLTGEKRRPGGLEGQNGRGHLGA